MEPSDVTRAVAAATSIATSLGLPADDAVVLHDSNKLALRLTPVDVLARVTHVGEEVARLELERARRLAAAGCPVGVPEPRVDPLVYARDGFAVTLWVYYPPTASPLAPADYAGALERLHAGMRQVDVACPRFTDRVAEAEAIVADPEVSPALAAADRAFLGRRLEHLRLAVDERGNQEEQLLHGEPHPGNVLDRSDGPVFVDFETCCRGPVEFDLAHVPEEVSDRYPGLDQDLLDDCRQLVLAMVAAWRWDRGDQFPDGRRWGEALLRSLRDGSGWPTLDPAAGRREGG